MLLTMMATTGEMWGQTKGEGDTHEFSQTLSQLLNNSATIAPINIAAQSYPIKKVTVHYRYNKTITNAVTIEVSVGGVSWGTQNSTGTGSNYTNAVFEGTPTTGAVAITFTNNTGSGTGHGTFWVDNVILTEGPSSGTPYISANDVNIAYDATEGSIAYTVNNPVTGGTLTASTTSTWLTPGSVTNTTVPFTCEANEGAERSATVTLTYTYNTNQTATKNVTVTQAISPNAPGTENNPYTVAEAIAATPTSGTSSNVYIHGIVSAFYNTSIVGDGSNYRYYISDDGTTTNQLLVYKGKGLNNVAFSNANDLLIGDIVTIYGGLTTFSNAPEIASGNYLTSLEHPAVDVEAPVITPASCGLETSMDVTITPADGTTIYYTTDGSDPDNSGTGYTTMQTIYGISETTTVKAIAYIGEQHSNVVSAVYTKITDIENITAVNTTYFVKGTVVATNSRGYVIGDGSEYVYVYLNAAPSVAVNNMVYVYGTTGTYGNIIQFTSSATISAASSTNYDGNPTATVITEVPNYSTGYHISTYLQYTGALTKTNSNYYINVGGTDIQISYPTTDQANTLTVLDGKNVTVKGYFTGINSSSKFTTMLESVEEVAEPAITLAQYEYNLNADGGDAELPVTYTNMPSDPQAVVLFYEIDGETALTENPNWITATINEGHNIAGHIDVNEGEARSAYFKVKGIDANDNEVYSNLVTINQAAAGATIEFNQTSMTLDAGGESDRKLSFDYSGLGNNPTFSINYYEQDGTTAATYDHDWLTATFEDNKVNISAVANTGEARSAYFRVYGENGAVNTESNLVTITQAEYVVDYATLPFSWAGNTSAPTGITNNGVGTYSSSPYLRFDGTGDYIILKINERPGTLTFDIQGNSFSGGTFKVQTSEDGVTYTDLATYTELGSKQSELFNNLGENVRYIKWIYTEKSSGNVALGNIALAVYDNTPSLSFDGSSANIGTYPTGEEITFDGITVSQNNLTENITLSVTKGTVTPNSIDAGADPTQVVWKYTPTEAGYTTTTITATSGTIEDSFEIQFVAKTPHSITIASGIEHGTVVSNKETAIENENVDLTVTPEDGYELSEITVVDSDNNPIAFVENTYRFVMPNAAVTVSATFTQSSTGDEEWVLTNLADLTSDDVFVIVGDNGSTYAMTNDNGTGSAPSVVEVTVANNKLSGTIAANIQWNLSGNATNGYTFYPNGSTTTWLYCNTTAATSNNNNMRVGTGTRKVFEMNSNNYLMTKDDYTDRYLSIYDDLNWRGYVNTNLCPVISFYKKTNGTTTPSITAANVSIAYDIEEGEIAYTINHPVEGGTVSAEINGTASWLYLDDVDQTNHKVPFLCDANDGAERAATVTLTYTYNTDETVTKSITITQAANPNVVDNISDITATGSYTVKGTIVAKSERGFIVGDGTGYVYYYNQNYDQSAYNIGDKVKLAGPVVAYGKVFEFNSETVVSESETSGYDPTNAYPTELTGAQMQTIVGSSDNRLSDFVVYHGTLSVSGTYYNIIDIAGATSATGSISYPLNTDFASLDSEQVTVIGYFVGVSSTRYNTMIGAVVKTPSIVADDVTIQYNETSGSITYSISDAAEDGWFNAEVEDGSWITITQPIGNDAVAFTCDENTGDAARTQNVTLLYSYHNYQDTIEKVVTVTQQPHIVPVASITVDPTELNVNADEHDGLFTVAYENIETDLGASVVWFESDGVTVANEPEWITADINDVTLNVDYIIDANTGDARTAYFKVYGLDGDSEDVYSNLVTITQAAPVIDYATLPFEWAGGTKEDLVANVGVSGYGLGSNYAVGNAPYRVRFDTDGDYILVKTNEQPGEVTVGIKKLGGANASSITIKGSSNGEDFSTIQTFDNEGDANAVLEHTTTVAFNENDRYVMIYFNKPSGGSNVGVGPITIAQVDHTPSITLSAYTIDATAEETDGGLTVTYKNIETSLGVEIHWFESTTSTAPLSEAPEWIDADFDSNLNVEYLIGANTGDARTAYFKVYGLDADANTVYSDIVTVTQAAYIPPVIGNNYVLYTGNLVEGDYLIVYDNGAMKNTVSNNRLQYVDVTENTNNNVIITDDAAIVWHIAQSGDYWTIYSAAANAYAASTGTKNQAQMLASGTDDKAKWTITGTEAYDFVNKANAAANINAYLRKNTTYGYACYAEGTGGSLSLYKKTELGKTFTATAGNAWNNPDNWTPAGVPTADDNVFINGSVIINNGVVATANIVAGGTITIENGGQLIHNNAVNATLQRNITGYGNDPNVADGWYLIASPVDKLSTNNVTTTPYDLYMYNEPNGYWYSNTGSHPFSTFTRGIGYLYANANDRTLNFTGSMIATNTTNIEVNMDYTSSLDDDVRGFNLAGNPFTRNLVDGDITIQDEGTPNAYYITEDGSNLSAQMITETPIKPGQGFMIQVSGENHKLIINPSAKDVIEDRGYIKIVAGNENGYDNAFIQINNGNTLRKLNIGYSTSVYVMSDGDDYAAARVEELAGTMPVHFNAVKEGEYEITVNTKNIEASTLLLFDNFKNETIDLLETPTYSFESSADDEDNRFKLFFDFNNNNYNGVEDNFTSEIFVYQSGDELIVNGEGTLQIFDVLGRLVTSKNISGVERIGKPEQTGVYIFRLNEHTQKLIIK